MTQICISCLGSETVTIVCRVEVSATIVCVKCVVSSQDKRRLFALVLCWGPRVAVLHALKYLYWITSNYGVSSLFDTAFTSYDGYVYVFLRCCVCAVYVLSAFHTDRCRLWLVLMSRLCEVACVRCVRALNFVHYVRFVKVFFTQDDCVPCVSYYRNRCTL